MMIRLVWFWGVFGAKNKCFAHKEDWSDCVENTQVSSVQNFVENIGFATNI